MINKQGGCSVYRNTSIGEALQNTLQEFEHRNEIREDLA